MKKNIVFYCHNFWWLGHTQRLSLIIKEIINNFWENYQVIFLNSGTNQDFILKKIKNLKVINLPQYSIENYRILKNEKNKKIFSYRNYVFLKLFSLWNIEKLIVEHFPFWRNFLEIEIESMISIYRKFNPSSFVFSSVRDIFDLKSLNEKNLYYFDRFLVHGDRSIINYDNKFSKEINRKIIYTWYVVDKSIKLVNKEKKDYVVISLWWWQDWLENIYLFLDLYKKLKYDFDIYINLWLLYSEDARNKIENIIWDKVKVKDYFEEFRELKLWAKLLISMWWYNSMIESLYYWINTIVYPRETDQEQVIRLNTFKNISKNIYDWRNISLWDIKDILSLNQNENSSKVSYNWAYFSSSFISNFWEYEYIKIRPTNACNAKCSMCWVIKRKWKYNDFKNLKISILHFYKIWWKVVNFTWWEPTTYQWFWELLEFSKELWFISSVSTNGSTLWKGFFERLYKNWIKLIDYIDISVDWLYELQDNRRKYKGLFKKISDNIWDILKNNIYLHINVTIRNDNISEMLDIFKFFKNKWISSISFWMVASDPLNDTTNLIPSKKQLEKFYFEDAKEIIKLSWNIKTTFSPNYDEKSNFDNFVFSIKNKNSFPKPIWKKCSFISTKKEIRINEWWDISPCCILDDFDEWLWNINKDSLLNIICSKKYEDFLNSKFPNISKACLNCKIVQ